MSKKDKEEAREKLDPEVEALKAICDKEYGSGSLFIASGEVTNCPAISTGHTGINNAIGIGGFPRGRITEIYGENQAGKTTLILQAMIQAQKAGERAAIVDAEHGLDLQYFQSLGGDVKKLLISQPNTGEQALDIVEKIVRSGLCSIVCVDSVAALVPQVEIEGGMGDQQMGLHARLMSKALRKLVAIVHQSNTALVFTNQTRQKIVMFGNPNTQTGGNALRFYASVRIEMTPITSDKGKLTEKIDGVEHVIGNRVKLKVVKNKVASPYRELEFDVIYGLGFDDVRSTVDMAIEKKLIEGGGAGWYTYEGERLPQGMPSILAYLRSPEGLKVFESIKQKVSEL